MLNLPLSYFEARRVGDSVARVRELERIREFLTSNSVTVVLDLFFTVIFFVVMYLYSPLLIVIVALSIPLYALISILITPGDGGRTADDGQCPCKLRACAGGTNSRGRSH